jgi:cytochrome c556
MTMDWRTVSAVLILPLSLAACRDDGPVVPAATTKYVMTSVTDPSSKVVFEAAAEPPKDAAGWDAVQSGAQATAESARRLIKAVRGGNKSDWVDQANDLISAAASAAAAAAARDPQALASAAEALYGTCESCHRRFQSKQDKSL